MSSTEVLSSEPGDDRTLPTRAEVCVVAVAECFRGDGEILANPIGTVPMIGGRLARATFEPDLCCTDGEATLVADDAAFPAREARTIEYWNPYRSMFDWVWSGRRHVMMGATQLDRYGNQNIAAIGDYRQPKVQLLGYRGAPGNTICCTTSYWIPNHGPKVLVDGTAVRWVFLGRERPKVTRALSHQPGVCRLNYRGGG
jgi:acyl CoA:acetate/3-ketoacid CoA transferase beta subunit